MKDTLTKLLNTFVEFWKAQEKKRKIIYIGALAAVLLTAIILTIALNTTKYVVLYDGLQATEAAEIVSEIQGMGIDVNLSGAGKITVPEQQENSLRMQLGVKGYPKSTLNYDVWNNNIDMFSTDYDRREQSRMALQERLIGTLETFPGVDKAIVTLSIPEQKNTVITVNAQLPSASVVLHLKGEEKLTDKQLQGVRRIVMTAVAGLTEENVTITDGSGNLLVEGEEQQTNPNDAIALERNKLIFKQQYQETIKQAILEQLIPAYGEGGATVVVSADLNYDQKVSEATEYTPSHPDGSGMISNQEKNNASGTNGANGGVVGVEPNADDTYPTAADTENGAWSQNSESTNYLVNTMKEQIQKEGFDVDSLSVSVIVYKAGQITDAEKETLQANVASAAGTAAEFVSIGALPKFTPDEAVIGTSNLPFGWNRQTFILFISALIVLIFVFLFLYVMVANRARKKRAALDRAILEAAQAAGESGQVDGFFGKTDDGAPIISLTEAAQAETKETAVRREIGEFAKNSPEIVAQLLRSWLREEAQPSGGSSSSSGRGSSRGSSRK